MNLQGIADAMRLNPHDVARSRRDASAGLRAARLFPFGVGAEETAKSATGSFGELENEHTLVNTVPQSRKRQTCLPNRSQSLLSIKPVRADRHSISCVSCRWCGSSITISITSRVHCSRPKRCNEESTSSFLFEES